MNHHKIFLTKRRFTKFEPIQHALVPRSRGFTSEERLRGISLINDLLSDKPGIIHFKLNLFINFILLYAIIKKGRSFKKLSMANQVHVLNAFFDSPVSVLRKGFWGLNTLAKLSVYGQHQLYSEFGYKLKDAPLDRNEPDHE